MIYAFAPDRRRHGSGSDESARPGINGEIAIRKPTRWLSVSRGEHHLRKRAMMYFREFIRWASNEGWSRKEILSWLMNVVESTS